MDTSTAPYTFSKSLTKVTTTALNLTVSDKINYVSTTQTGVIVYLPPVDHQIREIAVAVGGVATGVNVKPYQGINPLRDTVDTINGSSTQTSVTIALSVTKLFTSTHAGNWDVRTL